VVEMCLKHRQRANRSLTCGLLLIRQAGVVGEAGSQKKCVQRNGNMKKGYLGRAGECE